jgi:NAD(P)-dependent dehydrogenase (short-subunit alcohol dehydrogenase family)
MAKNVLVLGSSSIAGREFTELFLDKDYVVFGVSEEGSDISHGHYHDFIADLSSDEGRENLLTEISELCSQIDIFVNASLVFYPQEWSETSIEQFKDHFDINIFSQFNFIRDFDGLFSAKFLSILSVIPQTQTTCPAAITIRAYQDLIKSYLATREPSTYRYSETFIDENEDNISFHGELW